ncbi:hypothetical protein H7U19_00390 [Hyunsoonleella sp. SJ7]|uniref:Uncharacterized protein n=1 Tax=Hyunsoonleella aquatilis TaxID=2762758 RepID=A0A923H6F7_9FLAO|nr:transporter [Hyunsoonleella aquatilis]MBC3756841.1 hypothetical protein [Hyunsoonleella aquatilis]
MSVEEKGTFQMSLNYDYNHLNTLNNGTESLDDNSRLRITHSILLNMSYAITNHLSVEGLFTWVNQRRNISQFGNETLDQTSGIGDGLLLVKYNFKNTLGKNSNTEFGLGAKIPLGSSTETNAQGIVLNADLQPGSNAWDIVYFLSALKQTNFRPSLSISGRIIYRSTGTNESYLGNSSYKFGNEIQAFLVFSDQFNVLNTLANPSISFKYRDAALDEIDGFDLDNTGGNWLFIIPDISINITPNLIFSTRAELPLYSNVDGTQLTPTYRLTTGFLIKLKPKPKLLNL